jgi:hypothetical protein
LYVPCINLPPSFLVTCTANFSSSLPAQLISSFSLTSFFSFSFSALSFKYLCATPTVKGTSPVSLLGSGLTALFFSFSNLVLRSSI